MYRLFCTVHWYYFKMFSKNAGSGQEIQNLAQGVAKSLYSWCFRPCILVFCEFRPNCASFLVMPRKFTDFIRRLWRASLNSFSFRRNYIWDPCFLPSLVLLKRRARSPSRVSAQQYLLLHHFFAWNSHLLGYEYNYFNFVFRKGTGRGGSRW